VSCVGIGGREVKSLLGEPFSVNEGHAMVGSGG
jgi:hypothetical protein